MIYRKETKSMMVAKSGEIFWVENEKLCRAENEREYKKMTAVFTVTLIEGGLEKKYTNKAMNRARILELIKRLETLDEQIAVMQKYVELVSSL